MKFSNRSHLYSPSGCRLTQSNGSLRVSEKKRLERIECCVPVCPGFHSALNGGARRREQGWAQPSASSGEAPLGPDQRNQSTTAAAQTSLCERDQRANPLQRTLQKAVNQTESNEHLLYNKTTKWRTEVGDAPRPAGDGLKLLTETAGKH